MTECRTTEECTLRHKLQDELNNQIKDIHDALLGTPLSKEPSIKEKVSEMYKERTDLKKWFVGSIVTIIAFIFTLGITYERIQHLSHDVEELTKRVQSLEHVYRR